MESPRKTKELIGYLLLVLCALIMTAAVIEQRSSAWVQTFLTRQDTLLQLVVFTEPAMQFTYNPATRKAVAAVGTSKCSLQHKENCFNGEYEHFFIPKETDQETFWNTFKSNLPAWRFNPLIVGKVAWAYLEAKHDKRTDLSAAEFFLLTQNLSGLDITDFAIKYLAEKPKKKKSSQTPPAEEISTERLLSAVPQQDRPIRVEILNASGQRGLAADLTQYLREQDNKGTLSVDVLEYGNYPTEQETSSVIDYSGRLMEVTQISRAIGIYSEIKSEPAPSTSICEARIILGKDFQMPL